MKVSFYPDRTKSPNTIRTIWANIYENGNSISLNTHERVDTLYWDKKSQRASVRKARAPRLKSELNLLNLFLSGYETKIHSIRLKMKADNPTIEFSEIANEIKKEFGKTSNTLYDIFNDFIKTKEKFVGKQTIYKYKRLRTLLEEFEKKVGNKLNFNSFDRLFYDKFLSYLLEDKKMIDTSAYKNISFLKTFLGWANERKLNPNTDFKSYKVKTYENEVIFLSENDLKKLYSLELKEDRLARVRDVFLFQCYTGARYSDIEKLSRDDIKNNTWNLRTKKTKDIIQIPLIDLATIILEKYREYETPLPIISNQKMNKYLKELCRMAKINDKVKITRYRGNETLVETVKKFEVIATHTARRTFISLSVKKGMTPEVIMKITGHRSYRMFQKYLKIADDHTRQEMIDAWD